MHQALPLTQLFSILPGGSAGKESACNVGDLGLEDPLERGTLPTPVFWHGEFPGQRALAGYSPRGRRVRLSQLSREPHTSLNSLV